MSEPAAIPRSRSRVLAFAAICHALTDGIFAILYPLLPVIAADLGLNYGQASLLNATFAGGSAVCQIPAGFLAERVGEYTVLTFGNFWLSLGFAGMGLATAFLPFLVLAIGAGIGGSAQHPVGASLVSRTYENQGRTRAIGTLNFSGDLGKLVGPVFAGFVAARYGWRVSLQSSGLVCFVIVLALWLVTRASTIGKSVKEPQLAVVEANRAVMPAKSWGIASPKAFTTLIAMGALDESVRGSALMLLPFVLSGKGYGTEMISLVFMVIFAGGAAGKFICGWISERFGSLPVIWGTEIATALTAVLFLVAPTWGIFPLAILFGFSLNGTSSVLYAAVAGMVVPERRGRVYGVFYTAGLLAESLAPILYGTLGDKIGLLPAYSIAVSVALTILPLAFIIRRQLAVQA